MIFREIPGNPRKSYSIVWKKNTGFLTRFLGLGIFWYFFGLDFWGFLEDFGGDFWRIFGGVLDGFSYSFGVFLGGFLEGFSGIFLDGIFLDGIFLDGIFFHNI